ncbi:tRNA (adenosine(37)-N6)-threonylcarbamoyltransferase complex ATPase subunit type 1 TsaE [Rhizobium sp. RU20A]|uniref:tRNA (adenosine(37)-N6)-threonylcarbamoyltransferase complex ATPase subunit type 1 TsaE n=1 Tax=Rhizobium sp. RU20A TaxID=1907412 RepID=UPI001FCE4CFC|nr:tRNA (adenosine(37)-N6)-threonylcarbamoyltransferase complex ATPase subunit type 1 TsaE [Rhizobium sp. RU20A]
MPRHLADEQATQRLGEDLALALRPGDCLALVGDLGAGKSTLARALIRALAGDPDLEVPSPTFTLVQEYALSLPIGHFDLYRISDPDELHELGLDDMLAHGACLIEWPERAEGMLPKSTVTLTLTPAGTGRDLSVSGKGPAMERILRTLALRDFLVANDMATARRRPLGGDASARGYNYVDPSSGATCILMDAPRSKPGPILRDGKYYQQLAHIAEDVVPFVAVAGYLRRQGFRAPDVLAADLDQGTLLLEDLGTGSILDEDGAPVEARYADVARTLAAVHAAPLETDLPVPGGPTHAVPPFDRTAMQIEVSLLTDWFLPFRQGGAAKPDDIRAFVGIWDDLIDTLEDGERHLLLRDVHSPNIIWQPGPQLTRRVGLLDFQDAMIGPTAYDVASLVQDARVSVPEEMGERLLATYIETRQAAADFDTCRFRRDIAIMAAQRNCKLLGIWIRLMQRDGKPGYMRHMPRTLIYLEAATRHPVLAPLRDWLTRTAILGGESDR